MTELLLAVKLYVSACNVDKPETKTFGSLSMLSSTALSGSGSVTSVGIGSSAKWLTTSSPPMTPGQEQRARAEAELEEANKIIACEKATVAMLQLVR